MSTTKSAKANCSSGKKFIINLFGESGMGKTTVLRQLIEMLRSRSKYNVEVSEGFQTHDLRSIMWYRAGRKYSGAVCVCTMGDSLDIIKNNLAFFDAHFDVSQSKTPWDFWKDSFPKGNSTLQDEKSKSQQDEKVQNAKANDSPIGILITASRKPFGDYYKKIKDSFKGYIDILNIPIQIEVKYNANGHGANENKAKVKPFNDWMASLRSTPELLLFHINYLLRNEKFRSIKNPIDFERIEAGVSRD